MNETGPIRRPRRIAWRNVLTVVSAAILISAEVFGAAFAGGWALENLTGLGSRILDVVHALLSLFGVQSTTSAAAGVLLLQAIFFVVGVGIMAQFVRVAHRVEPFTAD